MACSDGLHKTQHDIEFSTYLATFFEYIKSACPTVFYVANYTGLNEPLDFFNCYALPRLLQQDLVSPLEAFRDALLKSVVRVVRRFEPATNPDLTPAILCRDVRKYFGLKIKTLVDTIM